MANNRKDQAVSEVMGSILMVALVVILAAIIGAFVFGMVGSVQSPNLIGVSAVRSDAGNVTVTYISGGDSRTQVYWMSISVNGTASTTLGINGGTTPLEVGNSTIVSAPVPGNDHIVVVGRFSDGTDQIVLDTLI